MAVDEEQSRRIRLEGADALLEEAVAGWSELGTALRRGNWDAHVPLIYRVVTLHPRWLEALQTAERHCAAEPWPARSALRKLFEATRAALLEVATVFGTQDVPGALLARMEGGSPQAWATALQQAATVDVDRATIFAGELDGLLAREDWTSADAAGVALLLPALDALVGEWSPREVRVGEVLYSQAHTLTRIDQLRRRGWQRTAQLVEDKLKGFEAIDHELPALVLLVCIAVETGEVDFQPSSELPPDRAALATLCARLFIARPRSETEWRATADLARRVEQVADGSEKRRVLEALGVGGSSLEEAVFRVWAQPPRRP